MEIGELIEGKYRITRLIGEGGMGAVYLGENVRISRKVAIKLLHAGLTENREVTQRFEREAQAAGRIGNDHILEVLDLGTLPNGDHYIVMEYLDGEPLSGRIKERGRLQPLELAQLIRQVLVGLGAAHRAGIVHRDLKPDNIFVLKEKAGKADFVKIIDFGISKFQPLNNDGMRMTRTGMMMGTPYYMSPEQASGSHEADHRADLYAVGVMMFEASTGQVPFDAATFNQLLFKIALDEVPRPEVIQPDLDPAFASLISKAMARDMLQRFQSADDFIHAIDAWLKQGTPVTIPPSADPRAASLLRPRQTHSVEAAPAMKTGTGGTWATSQVDEIPKKKSNLGLMLGIAAVLVVGSAGAVVALRSSKAPDSPPEAASSSTPSTPTPPVEQQAAAKLPEPTIPAPPEPPASAAAPAVEPAGPATSAAVAPGPGPKSAPKAAPAAPKTTSTAAAAPAPAASKSKRRDFGY